MDTRDLKDRRSIEEKVAALLGWRNVRLEYSHIVNGRRVGTPPGKAGALMLVPEYLSDHDSLRHIEEWLAQNRIRHLCEAIPEGKVNYEVKIWSETEHKMIAVIHPRKLVAYALALLQARTGEVIEERQAIRE